MTSRGFASLQVAEGLPEVLTCPWVADHAVEVERRGGTVQALADDVRGVRPDLRGPGIRQRRHRPRRRQLVRRRGTCSATAPHASWQAFLGADTEQPGLWLAYTPATGLVEGCHVDHDVMIPVDWADPATRTGAEEAQLARITAVRATLAGSPGTANAASRRTQRARHRSGHRGVGAARKPNRAPHPTGVGHHDRRGGRAGETPGRHLPRTRNEQMSNTQVEPINDMLGRWWAAVQAGDRGGAAIIIDLWRAEVIAAAAAAEDGTQP